MHETLGQFVEPGITSEFVIMSFSTSRISIQDRWRNNSLSADFMADYWKTFLLSQKPDDQALASRLRSTVSYIANELLENAVKFHQHAPGCSICLSIYQVGGCLRFYVSNSISANDTESFRQYLRTLLTEDPEELFFRQIERNALNEESTESHLGLLTLVNDYQARLGWKFEQADQMPDTVIVTTMAELAIDE